MINYIIQVILFQTLFLAVYDFFLAKETFFTKNRWYLLVTAIGSFLIPFINLPTFQQAIPKEISIVLPEIVLSPQSVIEQTSVYQSFDYGILVFWIGLTFFSLIFGYKLYRIIHLIVKNSRERKESYYLITLPNSKKAFSFFNYVFLGANVDEQEKDKIISHELIHCKQKHSIDLLVFESLKIVMWFNPLVYIYQKRISTVHEYISDDIVVKSTEKKQYINKLVSQLFDVEYISFVNQFYKSSLVKKRIKMIMREKSKQIKQVKYLLLIPVLASMLFYVSCSENSLLQDDVVAQKQETTFYGLPKFNYEGRAKESYLDIYFGIKKPQIGKRISEDELLTKERLEYEEFKGRFVKPTYSDKVSLELYKLENGRKMISLVLLSSEGQEISDKTEVEKINEDVPFTIIEKIPTFPGCDENDRKCFNKNMQMHFARNFNPNLPNKIGLKPGKKRIVMQFKIDKKGNIAGVKVKAPHEKLKEESIRIINMLPKMIPGEQDGKPVDVKYTLPMRIDVK
ncbi:MAG: energy transducer TonB [Flavobacteriaceae bacterium]